MTSAGSGQPPDVDERVAEHLLYVDATLAEMHQLARRGRAAYDSDIAVARACQYYWTVDDDIVWTVVEQYAPRLRGDLAHEVEEARSTLDAAGGPETGEA